MRNRCCRILGIIALTLLQCTEAWAQAPANPARPDEPSSAGSYFLLALLILPIVFMLVMVRRSSRVQPQMDRSLELAEEAVKVAKEQVALQTETNRLLARLIEARARD